MTTRYTHSKEIPKATVICYADKKGETFLEYYTYKTLEKAKKEAEMLNTTKPEKLWNGAKIDWTKVDYFFAGVQEEMY